MKKTMIKDQVGTVRKCAYNLPNSQNTAHIFGKEVKRDAEGAGKVLQKWVGPSLSSASESKRSWLETNRRAVAAKALSSKDFREFGQQHMIRVKPPSSQLSADIAPPVPKDCAFGMQTKPSDSSIAELIQAKHTKFDDEDNVYPDLKGMHKKGRLPLPRETRASHGQDVRIEGCSGLLRSSAADKKKFKMKKFERVQKRV